MQCTVCINFSKLNIIFLKECRPRSASVSFFIAKGISALSLIRKLNIFIHVLYRLCVRIIHSFSLDQHSGDIANSVDPDQPASSESG